MDYIAVQSSTIAAIGYDAASSTLGVRFLQGTEYHYYSVPEQLFVDFQQAGSKGRFLDTAVKKAGYSYSRVA